MNESRTPGNAVRKPTAPDISLCATSRMLRTLVIIALASLAPCHARADHREVYAQLAFTPGLLVARAPTTQSSAARPALGGEVLAYYGLTNAIHVGAALQTASASNLSFTTETGTLYADLLDLSACALLVYRLDTGFTFAPVARLELGVAHDRFTRAQVLYQGFSTPTGDVVETSFTAGASVALEYRFGDHIIASAGFHARRNFGRVGWSLGVPFSVGLIW